LGWAALIKLCPADAAMAVSKVIFILAGPSRHGYEILLSITLIVEVKGSELTLHRANIFPKLKNVNCNLEY